MKKIASYVLKFGLTWAVLSSIGKCSIDDVVSSTGKMIQNNNPALYRTINQVIESGGALYDIVGERVDERLGERIEKRLNQYDNSRQGIEYENLQKDY